MKQKSFKLWIIVLILIFITGAGFACSMINFDLEPAVEEDASPGYGDTVIKEETEDVLEIKKNFTHFLGVASDFINTVFLNGETDNDSSTETQQEDEIQEAVPEETPAESSIQNADIITPCMVKYVVDGDTFVADIGGQEEKIRLIGIDTPESVHADETRNNIWGQYASDHTKAILSEGQTVFLEYDIEAKDVYDRTLAYVWFTEDTSDISNMLNARLLSDGYAMDKVFEPNNKYAEEFMSLRQTAQQNGTGLWADEGFAALWEG